MFKTRKQALNVTGKKAKKKKNNALIENTTLKLRNEQRELKSFLFFFILMFEKLENCSYTFLYFHTYILSNIIKLALSILI